MCYSICTFLCSALSTMFVILLCYWPFYCVPYLSFCSAIGHSIVCPTCRFVLLLAIILCALLFIGSATGLSIVCPTCLFVLLLAILLCALLVFLFCYWPFYCVLYFDLRLLITTLISWDLLLMPFGFLVPKDL